MNKLIDQIVELYFLGGNFREILIANSEKQRGILKQDLGKTKREKRFKKGYLRTSYNQMFKSW